MNGADADFCQNISFRNAMTIKTISALQTKKIAGELAREIINIKFPGAAVIALKGNLGAGKTTFVQGFLRGLGIRSKITSPTFVLLKRYKIKNKNYQHVYHLDCYRIKDPKEIAEINFKSLLADSSNIMLIEWPERILKIIPENFVKIKFVYGKKECERALTLYKF